MTGTPLRLAASPPRNNLQPFLFCAAAVLTVAGCADREVITGRPQGAPAPEVPPEVVRAAEEAGRDGQILLLKEIIPTTGAVLRRQAKFVPAGSRAQDVRPSAPAPSTVVTTDTPADDLNPYIIVAPSGLRLPANLFGTDSSFSGSLNTFCFYNGQYHQIKDFVVDSLRIQAMVNTGGHIDGGHAGGKPKGRSRRPGHQFDDRGPSDPMGEWPFV